MAVYKFIVTTHGEQNQSFPTPGVDRHTPVIASICELADLPDGQHDIPFNGDAVMTIHGVAARDGGAVHVRYSVNWGSDLHILITILTF